MGLTPDFTNADIDKFVDAQIAKIRNGLLQRLIRVGEEFVNNARKRGNYKDRTGNLRSSIGYIVLINGEIHSFIGDDGNPIDAINFQLSRNGTDRYTGLDRGKKYADDLIDNGFMGAALIVVAGMNYAAALESGNRKTRDGRFYTTTPRDVLTGSATIAEKRLKELLNEFQLGTE